jgi:hypothetical protein
MNNSSGTLGGGEFYRVLPKLQKEAKNRSRAICQTVIDEKSSLKAVVTESSAKRHS